jgi:hypothetical protein
MTRTPLNFGVPTKADIENDVVWKPSHNGLKAVTFNPVMIVSAYNPPPSATMFSRIWVPAGVIITNVHWWLQVVGANVSAAQLGIYEADGTRSGVTGSLAATMMSGTGSKVAALGTPVPAQEVGRFVWVGYSFAVSSGTTYPFLGYSGVYSGAASAGIAAAPYASFYKALTSPLPSSTSMTTSTLAYLMFWFGVS